MTARKVRADYETLAEIAKGFDCEAGNTRRTLNQLHKDLDVLLDGDWAGRGATEFYREMISDVLPSVKRLGDALEQAARTTTRISRIMKQAEDDSARLFKIDWVEYFRQRGRGDGSVSVEEQFAHDFPGPIDDWIRNFIHWIQQQLLPPPVSSVTTATPLPPSTATPTQTTPPTTPLAPTESPTQLPPPTETPTLTPGAAGGTMYVSADGVNLRQSPDVSSRSLALMSAGAQLQLLSETPVQGGNHMWYQVSLNGQPGWVAGEYLSNSAPTAANPPPLINNSPASGGDTPVIVNGASAAYGNNWYIAQAKNYKGVYEDHFGVDISSITGDSNIYAPYAGEVVASNACAACTTDDPAAGNAPGHTNDIAYNYGYGATAVVEYSYANMSPGQVAALKSDGIELKEGQSLYLMSAHLNPNNVPASGTSLNGGDTVSVIGNSGNSDGAHLHIEAAINESGLRPGTDEAAIDFWLNTVAQRLYGSDDAAKRQGNRFDPTPLFDLGQ